MKMATKYKFGDVVWAKMKSFPAWPGLIEEPKPEIKPPADKKSKQFVRFFGSNNFAWIAEDLIWPYTAESKAKFNITQRTPQGFSEAVQLIEQHIASAEADKTASETPVNAKTRKATSSSNQPTKKARLTAADKKEPVEKKKSKQACDMESMCLPDILSSSTSGPSFLSSSNAAPLKIGFLGLGIMGSSIASALLQSGHDVTVWNRTPSKCRDFVSQGALKGISPADVVQSCDVTFSCVADSVALKELVSGDCGVLAAIKPGKAFVDLSSVDVETVIELYESITVRGGRFLEAPLVGTLQQDQEADRQSLIVLTAGDMSLYEDCLPCFSSFSKKTFYLGEVGSATSMKLVINMMFGAMLAGLAEMLALGEKVGLQQDQILNILSLLPISSSMIAAKGDAMVNGKFNPPQLSLELMQKGLRTAISIAEPVEQPVVVASATNELFKKAKARGYGDHDTSAIYRATD